MPPSEPPVLQGTVFENYALLSLDDLCRMCAVEAQRIVELVEEGIVQAREAGAAPLSFAPADVRRARIALRLQRDLEINLAGAALVLELMDEIERLRRRLHREVGR
jgi:chaperone modulatory protein CbpM